MNTRIKNLLARAGSAERPGFTLIELLIAVGALAFIAAGVAAIFDATGRTITAGKRVSAFGQYASLIERQMRADFESMTRDGFLVIRNEMADGNGDDQINLSDDVVYLYDGDTRARPRRIDEIMFFSKGQFVSARQALDPAVTARSDTARIYYGHGMRMARPAGFNSGNSYYTPRLDDDNAANASLGNWSPSAGEHPNKYASDWILLRHVTLLSPPESTRPYWQPRPMLGGAGRLIDNDTQIGLQPAAPSIFRGLNAIFPNSGVLRSDANLVGFTGGLVDVATTSLNEIRSIVMTADVDPVAANANTFFKPADNSGPDGSNAGVDGVYRRHPLDNDIIRRTQSWMTDALPGFSNADQPRDRTRIRCEPSPTNYVGSIADTAGPWSAELTTAIRRADQLMLSSSNFLPRCTEFIVEWSFGETWPTSGPPTGPAYYNAAHAGEILWYGMPRSINSEDIVYPYIPSSGTPGSPWQVFQQQSFRRINGTLGTHQVPQALIHASFNQTSPYDQLISYFGYVDPTFNPDANGDGKLESATDAASPTIQWIWPKLIRVTLSLADPADPSIEQTFQFVFEVPAPADQ